MLRPELLELKCTKELLNKEVASASMLGEVDIDRISQVLYVYKAMQHLTKQYKGVKTSYKFNNPFKGMGVVSITGKNIGFSNADLFLEAVELANNFEVYPKVNGTVQINFTFYGILKKNR